MIRSYMSKMDGASDCQEVAVTLICLLNLIFRYYGKFGITCVARVWVKSFSEGCLLEYGRD